MIIFHNFEHSSLPALLIKQQKTTATEYATTCDTLIILRSSHVSHPLNCPKTWEKEPKELKALKNDQFHNFEHYSLPTSPIKQTKNKKKKLGKIATACDTLMILCSSIISQPSTRPETWGKHLKMLKTKFFFVSLSKPICQVR